MSNRGLSAVVCAFALALSGCTNSPVVAPSLQAKAPPEVGSPAPTPAVIGGSPQAVQTAVAETREPLPVGAILRVRLYTGIDSGRSRSGDTFIGSLSSPILSEGRIVVPKGAVVRGYVLNASSSGRLKGRAAVTLTLNRVDHNGIEVPIHTNNVTWTSAGHKKRNLAWIGGSSAAGALIGGLVGGGKGALIGAGAGGGAGLAGAAATGKQQVRIPAESILTFRLKEAVSL